MCNKALRDLCQLGERWCAVLAVYRELRAAGAYLNEATYPILWTHALEAGALWDAVELLADREAAHGPAAASAYCSLISRLLKQRGRGTPAKQAAHAVWRALGASGQRLDAVAFRTGMNLCVELGRYGEATRLLEAMRAAGHRPGYGAYHILIKFHAERGDMDAARRLFTELRAYRGKRPLEISAYNTLLAGFVRLGDLTMARAVLDKARREGAAPDAYSYSTYAAGLAAAGRLEEAEAVLGEMAAAGAPPSGVVYGAILDGCARRNDWARAERLMTRMRSEGLRPTAAHYNMLIRGRTYAPGYGAAAAGYAVDGSGGGRGAGGGGQATVSAGAGTPAAAVTTANGAGGPPQLQRPAPPPPPAAAGPTAALVTPANAEGGGTSSNGNRGGDGGDGQDSAFAVESLLAEMRVSGLKPDAVTYGTLIHAAVRAGSISGALDVLAAMRVEGVAPDGAIFTSLMKLFRQQGRQAQALEFFSQLVASRSSAVDLWALSCLAALHASAGRMDAAAEAAAQAGGMAAEQGRPPPPEATYALLQGYAQQRQLRPALLAFRRFLASGGRPHRKMCEFLFRLCLAHFDFGAAGQVLRAMRLMRGLQLREELYRQWWQDAQRRMQTRRHSGGAAGDRAGGGGSTSGGANDNTQAYNPDTEKLKWWFGLPNRYYESEWR